MLDNTERWMEICALAAEEQDSVKLLALTPEITRLLDEKADRINKVPSPAFTLKAPESSWLKIFASCPEHRARVPGGCVRKTRNRHAVRKMKEGPSEPPCRRRFQTAISCFGPKGRGGERYG